MKKLIVFSFLICAVQVNAQDDKSKQQKKENEVKKTEINSASNKGASFVEGEIPTPEQQGYEKRTIAGEDVYYKQEGQLIIEYRPKSY